MSFAIASSGLCQSFGGQPILDQIELAVAAGERVVLLGANGAGKSTLLDILAGVRSPTAGQVLLEGQALAAYSRVEVARRIASVPQNEALPYDLSVIAAVLMGRAPHQRGFGLAGASDVELCQQALARVNLAGLEQRQLGTLSGGERQRVLIARALVQQPRLLLLDEPTASLDLRHTLIVSEIVAELARQGVAVISALHDLNLAPRFAQRVLFIHRGRIAIDAPVDLALTPERLSPLLGVELVRAEAAGRPVLMPV
ncbi:MAG: ABC transporter ATP-binding protein [Deltaproteobacteria bacterium]|nr:ABC transporter ATP-binding protein [Deltaproteobacteria bacterium]